MAGDDYSSVVGGGLKLKGAKPTGITKKKKKKVKTVPINAAEDSKQDGKKTPSNTSATVELDVGEDELAQLEDEAYAPGDGKTESERKHEEMRRKRLNERILKTGTKTHKQRVEELNKYLSNLSEHHDMPKIGPG